MRNSTLSSKTKAEKLAYFLCQNLTNFKKDDNISRGMSKKRSNWKRDFLQHLAEEIWVSIEKEAPGAKQRHIKEIQSLDGEALLWIAIVINVAERRKRKKIVASPENARIVAKYIQFLISTRVEE